MVVIKWYDDSTPTYADVFETVDYTNDPLVPLMHAPFNSDRKVKRKVLLDKTYTVNRGLAAVWNGATIVSSTYPELGTRLLYPLHRPQKEGRQGEEHPLWCWLN